MIMNNEIQNASGYDGLASSLFETLEEEYASLMRVHDQFERQLAGIRDQDRELIESAALQTNEEVNVLSRLKQQRDRQIRLLGRVLRFEGETISIQDVAAAIQQTSDAAATGDRIIAMREKMRAQALRTQERCRDVEFALEYSVHLGRELLQTIQGIQEPAGARHYTSKGGSVEGVSGTRSFLNRVG